MKIDFAPGLMFKVDVGEDVFAHGVMLSHFPYMAFYDKHVLFDEDGIASGPPMFVLVVAKAAYLKGHWGEPIRQLDAAVLHPIPHFFWQSPVNKYDCKIVEPIKHRTTASPNDCIGLESEAVWSATHVESRIADYCAGRPNVFAEALRVKL
jgi:hypothetical protein